MRQHDICSLPDELLVSVLSNLSFQAKAQAHCISTRFNKLLSSPPNELVWGSCKLSEFAFSWGHTKITRYSQP